VGWGLRTEVVASKESWHSGNNGGEGVPTAAACEGNKNLPSD
jgi:hypothetical protein